PRGAGGRLGEMIVRVTMDEAHRPGEGLVAGVVPHVDAARRIEAMALDEDDAEAGQRLAAPAHGRPVAVRAVHAVDPSAEQLVGPGEDRVDLGGAPRAGRDLGLPRDAENEPPVVPMATDGFPP